MFHDLDILHNAEGILLIASVILFFSIFAGKAGYRFGLPALLLFLGVGMLFGSDGLGIQFSNPNAAQFIGMLALSIILFSGGMDTKISEVKPIAPQGVILATIGVLATTFITGGFILSLIHISAPASPAITFAYNSFAKAMNNSLSCLLYTSGMVWVTEETCRRYNLSADNPHFGKNGDEGGYRYNVCGVIRDYRSLMPLNTPTPDSHGAVGVMDPQGRCV